jgi:hypothetical protein
MGLDGPGKSCLHRAVQSEASRYTDYIDPANLSTLCFGKSFCRFEC